MKKKLYRTKGNRYRYKKVLEAKDVLTVAAYILVLVVIFGGIMK